MAFGSWFALRTAADTATAEAEGAPWFAGYVDVTATPAYAMESQTGDGTENVVLSFIVAASATDCTPTWGAAYTLDEASMDLDLDRRLARVREQDRDVVISFGGQLNTELGDACADANDLEAAYAAVIDRYDVTTIDLDLEGVTLDDAESMSRRAQVIAALQHARRSGGGELAVWLTLPVIPSGLTEQGTDAIAEFLDAGVDLAGVNVMTMDYGAALEPGTSMGDAAESALTQTHRQLGILYDQADLPLGSASLWRKIGATPMIGQNDVVGEVFELADARSLNAFAVRNGLGRMSMWSLNRDRTCGANYPDVTVVSDSCSGVQQDATTFAAELSKHITGAPADSADGRTQAERQTPVPDDPETSPYPIWNENSSYLAGNKIVWHGNVYEAKWYTQGDLPDDPVLQESDTPWTLVGPVLPGEAPIPVPTLPDGFYDEWKPKKIYEAGDRVMFDENAFEARWWTQGDSPEAGYIDPGNSPWLQLDEAEIRRLLRS